MMQKQHSDETAHAGHPKRPLERLSGFPCKSNIHQMGRPKNTLVSVALRVVEMSVFLSPTRTAK